MKPILLIVPILFLSNLYAQNSEVICDTAIYSVNVQIPYCMYSAIATPPKHNVSLVPLCATFVGAESSPITGISVGYVGRLKKHMLLDGKIILPYSKDEIDTELKKTPIELGANISYKFAQRLKYRKNHIVVTSKHSTGRSGEVLQLFEVDFQMPYVTNYYVTGGANFLRTSSNNILGITDTNYSRMSLTNQSSGSLNIGITRDRYTYHLFNSKEQKKVCYRYYRVRNYLYLTYSPYTDYDVIGEWDYTSNDPKAGKHTIVTSGYVVPTRFRKLGWRFGAEVKCTSNAAHNGLYLGLEFGQTYGIFRPPYKYNSQNYSDKGYWIGSLYCSFKLGFEFGTKNHETPTELTKFK